ncbi:MAG TPA: ABC transporter permease subunit [Victivallales bacterium]|nr:ABC transporter permease subunit [Victivallales bacterium]HRR05755.1 ABC transporter permease subunit [Victivallales bacterium]HRU00283.1 ABC transporter permease subunit [Victivallales bacterium]
MKVILLKKILYSILILFGVIFISFILFRITAGDPAPMLLGKNPSPKEIEDIRDKISSGLPLLVGNWVKTEVFSSVEFSQERNIPSVILPKNSVIKNEELSLIKNDELIFKRNFPLNEKEIKMRIKFKGKLYLNEPEFLIKPTPFFNTANISLNPQCEEIKIIAMEDSRIKSVNFFKPNTSFFNSLFLNSIKELVNFSTKFPFISIFNFGTTLLSKEKIGTLIWRSMWVSLSLMLPIFIFENMIAIPIAMFAAINRGKLSDKLITVISVISMSISYIVLIVLGQWFLAYKFGFFPIWGFEGPRYLILPVILGIISATGTSVRFYRTIFLDELRKEYIRTAFAKGLPSHKIYFKHLLKNALIPIIARISTILPFLFTGSLLLESFFGIPGLGYEAVNALNNSDIQVLKALVILTAIIFITMNLIADILNSYIDPRISQSN